MADLSTVQRVPEALIAVKQTVVDLGRCFECIEAFHMHEDSGQLDFHLYNMVVKLNEVIAGDMAVHGVDGGVLDIHENVQCSLGNFTRSTQILLKNVIEAGTNWTDAFVVFQRIQCWKTLWQNLSDLLFHLLKAELMLATQCISSGGVSKSDICDARFSHFQILTHRNDTWGWKQTKTELRELSKDDNRAARVVSELRVKRLTDRLKTSLRVSEEIISEMWREEHEDGTDDTDDTDQDEGDEDVDEKESSSLKRRLNICLTCIEYNIGKLEQKYLSKDIHIPQKRV